MQREVRDLRKIEQAVLKQPNSEEPTSLTQDDPGATLKSLVGPAKRPAPEAHSAGAVVLADCAAGRGILKDDQEGPLPPPGLRMAEALQQVRESIQRNLEAPKGGSQRSSWAAWPGALTGDWSLSKPSKTQSGSMSRTSRK